MNKPNVTKFINDTKKAVSKHSPEILTGLGIAGMVTTTVLAVKATPKAIELIEAEKRRQNIEIREEARNNGYDKCPCVNKLKPIETIKVAWKPYIPAAITGIASITCLVGASSVSARRNAALATAYQLSTTALSEYKEKVVETIGEKKEKVVREKVAQERVNKNPVSQSEVIVTKKGDTLFYEPLSGRYFKSDIESVKKVVNELNKRMIGGEQYISLSEFYSEIGLSTTAISDDIGWRVDRDIIEIDYPAIKADDDTPCLSLDYLVRPEYDYDKLY